MMSIESMRLKLIPATSELINQFLGDKEIFEQKLGVRCPDSWPVEKDVYPDMAVVLSVDNSLVGWLSWLIIHKEDKTIIGDVGFKGKPDQDGVVEIGYSVIPEYRNMGFGYEAAYLLTRYAFCIPDIKTVIAYTSNKNVYSIQILRKLNMYCCDSILEEDREVLKWKITKEEFLENEA